MTNEVSVTNIELAEIDSNTEENIVISKQEFGLVKNVPINIEVYLGQCETSIGELFSLKSGEVLKLDKDVNEPISLKVNGQVVALGNLVAIDGKFGVEISEVAER